MDRNAFGALEAGVELGFRFVEELGTVCDLPLADVVDEAAGFLGGARFAHCTGTLEGADQGASHRSSGHQDSANESPTSEYGQFVLHSISTVCRTNDGQLQKKNFAKNNLNSPGSNRVKRSGSGQFRRSVTVDWQREGLIHYCQQSKKSCVWRNQNLFVSKTGDHYLLLFGCVRGSGPENVIEL